MCLFFLIQKHQLSKFCMGDLEYMAIFHCFVVFVCNTVQINHFVMYKNGSQRKNKTHPNAVEYFREPPFYNKPFEKPKIKCLKNIDLLSELLPFFEELYVIKTNHAFKGYAMSYKVEIIERKDPINQLETSKSSIRNLFSDLLNETKGFKCQITVKVMLKKYKSNGKIEFIPDYFNSKTKIVINHKFSLENYFKEILHGVDNWINKRSAWIAESIESQCMNISTYRPLSGSYTKLPAE